MSGMYGTVKPADINIDNDVQIFYHYRPSLNSDDTNFENYKQLDNSVLSKCKEDGGLSISGLFNLKLPMDKFGKKGVYTIYIQPKEYRVKINDIGVLAAYPDVRGVVFSTNDDTMTNFKGPNTLAGYRIEYLNNNTGEKTGSFKIITSSNLASATNYMLNNSYDKGVKYRFDGSGTLIFCTVTPSLASTFKPNDLPNLGISGEEVVIVNTKFNPIMLEIEMVEHDAETIGTILTGDQLIDKDNALVTTFNKKGEIFTQSEFGVYKDEYGNSLYEFKKNKENIDFTQNMGNLE